MNILFRVDATKNIGLGHLARCFALSEELIRKGDSCFFISNIQSQKFLKKINGSNITIEKVSSSPKNKKDLEFLINFAKKNEIDWIITDHYDINSDYIKELKVNDFKVLSIDDNAQIYYYSDIVVNQNIGAEKLDFNGSKNTKFLLGPKYVMLRDELLKKQKKKIKDNVESILVTLGGIGFYDLNLKIIKKLKKHLDEKLKINIVIGGLDKSKYDIISKIKKEKNSNFEFIFSPEDMSELYLKSDIAISSGGSSCYELAYFGVPNVIISLAENQLNVVKELDKKNISIYLGGKEKVDSDEFLENILKLINNKKLREKMIKNGMNLIDGKGKKRTADLMNSYK